MSALEVASGFLLRRGSVETVPRSGSDFQRVPEPAFPAQMVENLLLAAEPGEDGWKGHCLQSRTPAAGGETAEGVILTQGGLQRLHLQTSVAASETQAASKTGRLRRVRLQTQVAASEAQAASKTGRLQTQVAATETQVVPKTGCEVPSKKGRGKAAS